MRHVICFGVFHFQITLGQNLSVVLPKFQIMLQHLILCLGQLINSDRNLRH